METTVYRLEEILENYDYLRKPLSSLERESFKGEYPYYGAQGVIDYVQDYLCDGKYMLIAEDGENLNSRNQPIALIAKGKFWVNNHAHIVKTNHLANMDYVCYVLNNLNIAGYVTGSAQPKLSQSSLNKIKISIPSLEYQERVLSIISKYDELIEVNNQRIKKLEQTAEELYKEWFVRFRFPNYQNCEYKNARPSGWVVNDTLEYSIPVDWRFDSLSNIASFKRGRNLTTSEAVEGDIPVVSAGKEPSCYHNEANVKGYSITISSSGANAGYMSYHLDDIWAADCSYYQNDINIWFVYSTLHFIQKVIDNMQIGAAQPHVYPKDINELSVLIPDGKMMRLFNEKVNVIFEEIKTINKKNENLIKQRDLLLPRLMSGKMEV